MGKRKIFTRIAAVALAAVLLITATEWDSLMAIAGNLSQDELNQEGWDYGFTIDTTKDFRNSFEDLSYLKDNFKEYRWEKSGTGNPTCNYGNQPGQGTPGTGGLFFAGNSGSLCKGSLRPYAGSFPSGSIGALTYKDNMENFRTEYTFYGGKEGDALGLLIGGAQGTFPISTDGVVANDNAVALYMNENGNLYIYGAINMDESTFAATGNGVVVEKNADGDSWRNGTDHIKVSGLNGGKTIDHNMNTDQDTGDGTYTFTVGVEMKNGRLKVYEKDHSDRSVTIGVSPSFQSGQVSLYSTDANNSGFKSFCIKELTVPGTLGEQWDTSFVAPLNGKDVSYLDDAFAVYQYAYTTDPGATGSKVGPVNPSAIDPNSYQGGFSYFTTKAYGTSSRGGLKPTYIQGGDSWGYTTLTYKKEELTDFEAEYSFYAENVMGLVFGGEAGKFQITQDNNNSNDTAVALYMEGSGKLCVYGAIDTTNVSAPGDVTVEKNTTASWYSWITGTANIVADGMTGTDNIQVESELTESSGTFTVCVKVQDGVLTVYEKGHSDKVLTVGLSDQYQGGPVSLFQTNTQQGAFKSFGIRKLADTPVDPDPPTPSGDWDREFTAALGDASFSSRLDDDFEVYQYHLDSSQSLDGAHKPSDTNPDSDQGSASYYTAAPYGNNSRGGLKPTSIPGKDGQNGYMALTYHKEPVTDFEAEYGFYRSWGQAFGLAFGGQEKGVFPVSLDSNLANDTGVALYMEGDGTLILYGAIDPLSASVSGNVADNGPIDVGGIQKTRAATYSFKNLTDGKVLADPVATITDATEYFTVHVKVENGILSVWEKDYPDNIASVRLTERYQGGYVSLFANQTGHGAFHHFGIKKLSYTAPVQKWDDTFESALRGPSVGYLDDLFDVYQYQKPMSAAEALSKAGPAAPTATDPNSWQGQFSYFTTQDYGTSARGGLKPTSIQGDNNNGYTTLTYKKDTMTDFEAEYEFYADGALGLAFGGPAGTFPVTLDGDNSNDTGAVLFMEGNGNLSIYGAIDTDYVTSAGELTIDRNLSHAQWYPWVTGTANLLVKGLTGSDTILPEEASLSDAARTFTVCVQVKDGILTVYEKHHGEKRISVELTRAYQGGTVSLFHTHTQRGAFKSFGIKKLPSTGNRPSHEDPVRRPAQVGEGVAADFTALSPQELNVDYKAWYFENEDAEGVSSRASERWTTGRELPEYEGYFQNDWLKPMHKNGGQYSLLTEKALNFKNVEVVTEYITNHVQYGVMIAPEGELAKAGTGVRIWAEGDGTIMITGAVDAATGKASGGLVRIRGKNTLGGFPIDGYVGAAGSWDAVEANKTSYRLHVRISGKALNVWLEEFPEYVISVNLTDDYTGGALSVYSTGYNQGGFKELTATEIEDHPLQPTEGTYVRSFNTTGSLNEIAKEYDAYYFDTVEKKGEAKPVSELFQLVDGKMRSKLPKTGNDEEGLSALTLKNRRYENFELTLRYEQAGTRYGIMFGLEPGEFAYTKKGERLVGNGGIFAYTDAEGGRHVKGSMDASFYTNGKEVRYCKLTDCAPDFYAVENDPWKTINAHIMHTMTVRVVGDYMTMVIDKDEATRVTVHIPEYHGGYISLVSNAGPEPQTGAFCQIAVRTLEKDAQLETEKPPVGQGFKTMQQVAEQFAAYHLEDAEVSGHLDPVELSEHWWLGNNGYVTRTSEVYTASLTKDVDVLTYTKQKYTDFEMIFTYQQNWQRLGVMIGTELGEYPLYYQDGRMSARKGAIFFMEAEGNPIVAGSLRSYTDAENLFYRNVNRNPSAYTDETGNASENVNAGKPHTVRLVVKDKQMFAFLDGSDTPSLYVKLGKDYEGGYVSLIAHTRNNAGINYFSITDQVTAALPEAGGVSSYGNTFAADFDSVKFDSGSFSSYFMEMLKNNAGGSMAEREFDDMWTVADGSMTRHKMIENGSDSSNVSVLTYNKRLTNFVVTYDYQKYDKGLMLLFGAEKGKYPLCNKGNEDLENGGVILFPENDLGTGGGIVALGGVDPLTAEYRPIAHQKVTVDGYHQADWWESNFGKWHTMTVAVVNKHCYVWLDEYGLVDSFNLVNDYDGGFVSFAAAGSKYGFDNIRITDLSEMMWNSLTFLETPRDLKVGVGTELSALELPETLKGRMKNGQWVTVPVDWVNMNYDGSREGIYQLTAVPRESPELLNTARVGAVLQVRVGKGTGGGRVWTFDTADDLHDFRQTFFKNQGTGFQGADRPKWFVSADGKVQTDLWRTPDGDLKQCLGILTYTGAEYTNFELEVEYAQNWRRAMVMFGMKNPGSYMNLEDLHDKENPVMAFVEMEGVRNFVGNVKNANYYTRTDEDIYEARESGVRLEGYFDLDNMEKYVKNVHTMKIRVVGDQASMWVDNCKEPMTITLTDYDGGYISLVSTQRGAFFDNLRITRLNEEGEPVTDPEALANGHSVVSPDKTASTDLVIPEREKPEAFEVMEVTETKNSNQAAAPGGSVVLRNVISGGVILAAVAVGVIFLLLAVKKRKGMR